MDEQRAWKARNKASRLLSITTGIEKNLFSLCICVRGHPLCYQQQWCVCVCVCVCVCERASERERARESVCVRGGWVDGWVGGDGERL